METTYKLKPNLTWHDGQPLTADDFVFSWRVYTTPELGIAGIAPHALMEDVTAPDPRTVVIRWKQAYPEAGSLEGSRSSPTDPNFTPLPRHILEPIYQQDHSEGFLADRFWTTSYVNAGPYKIDKWEPGAFFEAVVFDGHALGRAKIDRIRVTFNADPNTVLASLLAGEAHMPIDDSIRIQQGLVLKQNWAPSNAGTITYRPTLWRLVQVQHRPEYANPKAVLDLRVRKALAHSIDKQAINDNLFEGQGILSDSYIYPSADYFPQVDRAVAKYPYDLRMTEQYMNDAGYRKGSDGVYASPTDGRVNLDLKVIASAQNDAERTIMADGWRRAGFEVEEGSFTPAQSRDGQILGTFRALSTTSATGGAEAVDAYSSSHISSPETRWLGSNRGAWSNADYDRFAAAYVTTLDRNQRTQPIVDAAKLFTEQLGGLPLYFNPSVLAYPSGLTGINIRSADGEMSWNMHQWEFRS
jgi:peptide/nickel transport system substrate-binding protein